jgi:hypothetical protein
MRYVPVHNQKPGPRADNSHYASRRADELSDLHDPDYSQEHNARAGGKSRNQIAHGESDWADGPFQRGTKNVQGEKVEKQMEQTCMQKKRGEKAPVFALH